MYLDSYIAEIKRICHENGVSKLYAFGSVITERFNDKSDIDLLINIASNDPLDYGEKYFNVSFALEDLLKRKVDLLEEKALKNKYLKANIDETKMIIYGA